MLDALNPLSENFILKTLIEIIGDILDYLNPFSENFILKSIINFLGSILDYLNPFSENFFGKKLLEMLGNLLHTLFVPSQAKLEAIPNVIMGKFAFIDSIKTAIKSIENIYNNINATPSMTIDIPNNRTGITELTVIDLSWYAPYKNYGDLVITAFAYIFFIWRVFVHIPSIVDGVSTYSETEFKIDNYISRGGKK